MGHTGNIDMSILMGYYILVIIINNNTYIINIDCNHNLVFITFPETPSIKHYPIGIIPTTRNRVIMKYNSLIYLYNILESIGDIKLYANNIELNCFISKLSIHMTNDINFQTIYYLTNRYDNNDYIGLIFKERTTDIIIY